MYLPQIAIAVVLGLLFMVQVFAIRKRVTRLGLALAILSVAFVIYAILMIPQIDVAINQAFGGVQVVALMKNMLLLFPTLSCVISWPLWGVSVKSQVGAFAIIVVQAVHIFRGWESARQVCHQQDRFFSECALTVPAGAASVISSFVVLIGFGLVTVWLFRSIIGWSTAVEQCAALLAVTVILGSAWCLVAAIGTYELFTVGEYSSLQRAIRPPVAVTVAVVGIVTSVWIPVARAWHSLRFLWQVRSLLNVLDFSWWSLFRIARHGSESVVMDALSDFFTMNDIELVPLDQDPCNAAEVVSVLEKQCPRGVIEIPALAAPEVQHVWLKETAKVIG